jgi:hypothetical protein
MRSERGSSYVLGRSGSFGGCDAIRIRQGGTPHGQQAARHRLHDPRKTFPRERPSMRWLFAGRSWRVGSLTQKGATTTYVVTPSL